MDPSKAACARETRRSWALTSELQSLVQPSWLVSGRTEPAQTHDYPRHPGAYNVWGRVQAVRHVVKGQCGVGHMTVALPQVPCCVSCGLIQHPLPEEIQLHPAI